MKRKQRETSIQIETQYEGIHYYAGAPSEVAYLRNPHRHIFVVKVEIDVYHDDRELEFIMMKHTVERWLKERLDGNGVWQMGPMSCEQVATQLVDYLESIYCTNVDRDVIVSVLEDGENGATVYSYRSVVTEGE